MMPAPPTAKRIEMWPLERLVPYEKNARTHSPAQIQQIAASITEFGFTNPILVDGADGILAGHGRLAAAKDMGLAVVPVIVLDHLSAAQRKAYILADNQLALNAGWDMDALRLELGDLQLEDFDLSLIGFSDEQLADLMPEVEQLPPEDADADAVPEPPVDPVTQPGDVWLLGKHRVMCGDSSDPLSIDTLLQNKMPNAVLTDPPYGIGIDGQKESKSKNPKHNRKAHEFRGWDSERPDEGIFNYIVGLQCPAVIWGGNYFADLLPATRGWIYWSKGQDGLSMSDGELAWTTEGKPLRCVTVNRAALQGSLHPTQKPLQVIEFSLDYITAGAVVLDLFGGSGSTLIACEKTGRHACLMELDPRYCDVIVNRWQQFTGKTATLESTGESFPVAE